MKFRLAVVFAAALFVIILLVANCTDDDNGTSPTQPAAYEIHEWGVLVGCQSDTSLFLTSRPEIAAVVREPVIYVHSESKTPFSVTVTFAAGVPTDTYPPAEVDNGTVRWNNVEILPVFTPTKPRATDDFIPLDSIIDILNDVDADMLGYDSIAARFLFYEGNVTFRNKISVSYDFDAERAVFRNDGQHPVFEVTVAAVNPDDLTTHFGVVQSLDPGQQDTTVFVSTVFTPPSFDLVGQGFTPSEAQAFATLWDVPIFFPETTGGTANLAYRLSQNEYDEMISLRLMPTPEKIIRALYLLIHLDE